MDEQFDWRILIQGEYRLLTADAKGVVRSRVFPGLWLSVDKLLNRDASAVLATLDKGLRSRPHKTIVAELAARRKVAAKTKN